MLKKNKNNGNSSASLANTRTLSTLFFQTVLERQFAEAERILESLRTKMSKNEWNRGYLWALNGIILAQRSGEERYTYLTSLDLNDEETLRKNVREFLKYVKSDFHAEYDRGFFSAWTDFLRTTLNVGKRSKQADKV